MNLHELSLIATATAVALVMLLLALLLAFLRLVRGPTLPDRVVALDLASTLAVGLVAVYAMATGQFVFVDIALTLALISFLATVAFASYIEKGIPPRTKS